MSGQINLTSKRPKILAINDDPSVLAILGDFLDSEFEIFILTSGAKVLDFAHIVQPDLILLDIELPRLDSYALCEQLKFSPDLQDIPLIILTVKDEETALIKTLQHNLVEYVLKPFDTRALHQRIRNQLQVKTYLDYQKKQADQYKKDLEKLACESHSQPGLVTQMHHELRVPITEVVSVLERMLTQTDNQQLLQLLKKTSGWSQRLLNLIEDMLDITQMQAGVFNLSDEPFTLQKLLEHLNQTLANFSENNPISLVFDCDETLKCQIWHGDLQRLGQILRRLIEYVASYTQQGLITVTIQSEKDTDGSHKCLYFEVADNSHHLTESESLGLLDLDQALDNMDMNALNHTGLQLAIANCLIQQMGGTLAIRSVPEKGRLFFFRLTLSSLETGLSPSSSSEEAPEKVEFNVKQQLQHISRARILMVEDDAILQDLMENIFRSISSVELTPAFNGVDALNRVKEQSFDLILMDLHMPHMDGVEATRNIRQIPEYTHIPIIGVTSNPLEKEHQACLQAGMNEVFVKPILYETLCQILLKWLQHR